MGEPLQLPTIMEVSPEERADTISWAQHRNIETRRGFTTDVVFSSARLRHAADNGHYVVLTSVRTGTVYQLIIIATDVAHAEGAIVTVAGTELYIPVQLVVDERGKLEVKVRP